MTDTVEREKHANPNKIREDFYWLTVDFVILKKDLPKPPKQDIVRRNTSLIFGHPAEWASDNTALIAAMLHSWHEMLAEHRNETPPKGGNEAKRVNDAWHYLEPRFDHLCQLVDRQDLAEVSELHHRIRNTLGYNNPRITLPIPCPNPECELLTLQRIVGIGTEYIACGHCDYIVRDDPEGQNYRWLVRVCLDTLIGD